MRNNQSTPNANLATRRRTKKISPLLPFVADRSANVGLSHQIYVHLRQAILHGKLNAGSQVPPSRYLAQEVGVSRSTVIAAFDQLTADGLITGETGSGTYVVDHGDMPRPLGNKLSPLHNQTSRIVSLHAMHASQSAGAAISGTAVPFATGRVSIDELTGRRLATIARRRLAQQGVLEPEYVSPQGDLKLREQIAEYVHTMRGVRCEPGQVVIVSGSQQAIDISLRLLIDRGDPIWLEDPCYPPAAAAARAIGAQIVPVAVDEFGMCVNDGRAKQPFAKLAYVTPSHQYPLGVSMSLNRRIELLQWAHQSGAWIIEDDYDSEFRYAGPPLFSLHSMDECDQVIYVGTFSKIIAPSLRLGYAIVPKDLINYYVNQKFIADRHSPVFHQIVIGDFIEEGYLDGHLRRMRRAYKHISDHLTAALLEEVGHAVIVAPSQGMHVILKFKDQSISDVLSADMALDSGVIVRPLSAMALSPQRTSGLLLGFTGYTDQQLKWSTSRLIEVIKKLT